MSNTKRDYAWWDTPDFYWHHREKEEKRGRDSHHKETVDPFERDMIHGQRAKKALKKKLHRKLRKDNKKELDENKAA